ncbi:hypothetical protein [Microbacterium sp. YY-01]|uniref:hypothetical protein n=1 Tax=Microbacterium sp. YY-01 TaxID=3421634 RepID=UPI003D1631A8
MKAPLTVAALGTTVTITFADDVPETLITSIRNAWADATVTTPTPTPSDALPVTAVHSAEKLLEGLSGSITLHAIRQQRGTLAMFHAAGVADEHGRVAAFVGPSGRGKTTLSRVLGQHHGYVSDETVAVALDGSLTVHPYRKPLSVVRAGAPKEQVAPSAAGLQPLPNTDLKLAAIVLLERDTSAQEITLERIGLAECINDLVPQTSYLGDFEHPLRMLAELAQNIGGFIKLTYPDATDIANIVPAIFNAPPATIDWQPAVKAVDTGSFTPGALIDAIEVDDRIIVMHGSLVHVLDGIAPAIWRSACNGNNLEGITQDVIALHGNPPDADATELVDAALTELISAGLLVPREPRHS